MDALRTLLKPARAEINRQNAQRSTGPRTEAGKARSRGNALRHGLTGEGLALPGEDEVAVAERFAAFADQFRPATPLGAYYVHRMALATVRTDRLERHETAALALRVAHAAEEFDRARAAEADDALARLRAGEARAARRDLLRTPEGIARLVNELLGLRRCLGLAQPLWSHEHGARLDACLGIIPDPILPSRGEALTAAALGNSDDLLTPREQAAIVEAGRPVAAWALDQLAGMIDREVADLRADLASIDPTTIEADRLGAADRALFDPGPTAQLARRYEAAARRELDRSLRLFREVEAAADAPTDVSTSLRTQAAEDIEPVEAHQPKEADSAAEAPGSADHAIPTPPIPAIAPAVAPTQPIRVGEYHSANPLTGLDLPPLVASFGGDCHAGTRRRSCLVD